MVKPYPDQCPLIYRMVKFYVLLTNVLELPSPNLSNDGK